jgi:hypothetical protein
MSNELLSLAIETWSDWDDEPTEVLADQQSRLESGVHRIMGGPFDVQRWFDTDVVLVCKLLHLAELLRDDHRGRVAESLHLCASGIAAVREAAFDTCRLLAADRMERWLASVGPVARYVTDVYIWCGMLAEDLADLVEAGLGRPARWKRSARHLAAYSTLHVLEHLEPTLGDVRAVCVASDDPVQHGAASLLRHIEHMHIEVVHLGGALRSAASV